MIPVCTQYQRQDIGKLLVAWGLYLAYEIQALVRITRLSSVGVLTWVFGAP